MKVLVAGCGYVGTALATELVAAGHQACGLRRDPSSLPDGVVRAAADLLSTPSLKAVEFSPDAVVYCASAGGRTEERYRSMYVDGLRNVLDRFPDAGRVIFTGSTAVYGQSEGEEVDETSPTVPSRFTGEILLEAETLLAERCGAGGVSLRLGGIYGPGRTRLVRMVHEGSATLPGVPLATNRIHRDDCAGALHHLLQLDDPKPVYIGVDDDQADYADVLRFIANELGVPAPTEAGEPSGRAHKRCRNTRLKGSGYTIRVPSYRDGYPQIVREFLAG